MPSLSSNPHSSTTTPPSYQILPQRRTTTPPPEDSYYAVYGIFFLGGLAMLLPWNALITADMYFRRMFAPTEYANNFQNYISLCFTSVNFSALAVAVKYQGRFATLATQIFGALALNIVVFVFLASTAQFPIGKPEDFFFVTMFLVAASALGTSYMQTGLFGIAAQFPPIYILAVMSGQGVAGVMVTVSSMISAAINAADGKPPTDEATKWSGFYYFLFCTLVLMSSFTFFILLQKNPFYLYYTTVDDSFENTSSGATARSSFVESDDGSADHKPSLLTLDTSTSNLASSSSARESESLTPPTKSMLQISWQIRSYAFSCFLTFVVTLAAFPPLTASVGPADQRASEMYKALFVPTHFLLYNLGDWIGRVLPSMQPFHIVNTKAIFVASWLRVLFIVGFVFCNVNGNKTNPLPDWTFFLLIIFFSITNGWLGSLTMMGGPAAVHPVNSSVAGMLMSFYLTFGLSVGAMLSFLIRYFVCQCNPFMS